MTTIEAHYNKLLNQLNSAQLERKAIAECQSASYYGNLTIRELCNPILNEVAVAVHAEDVRQAASAGEQVPEHPAKFEDSGAYIGPVLCRNNYPGNPAFRIYDRALPRMLAVYDERIATMAAAFESYRLAVAQGVAVAPTE